MNQDDKIRGVEGVDDIICAEIPDRNIDPDLYNVVISNMMHGPCGPAHSESPCMIDGKCSKKYPRKFCDETISNEDGYPVYRRREVINGERRKVKCKCVWLDNRLVVPYCPYLSKCYNAHINVEICSSISAFKYLFKYVYKGDDRTTVVLQNDEIQNFVDACYLCAPEAVWHIFGFKFHHRSPAIQRLQIHLPNEQTMTFHDNTDITALLQNEHARKTSLTEFFTANQQAAAAAAAANGEPLDFDCRELLYQEFPTHMTWNHGHRRWNQ